MYVCSDTGSGWDEARGFKNLLQCLLNLKTCIYHVIPGVRQNSQGYGVIISTARYPGPTINYVRLLVAKYKKNILSSLWLL